MCTKIKKNLIGILAMLAAVAISLAAGRLSGPGAGGDWLAEAAGASPSPSAVSEATVPAPQAQAESATEAIVSGAPASLEALVEQFRDTSGDYYDDKGFSSNRYDYTDEDLRALATVIYLEAGNQPYECKMAVGNVVMDRVLAPGFPGKTIKEVVSSPNQFCYNPKVTPNAECLQAARDILEYQVWVVPQDTYFFRANKSTKDWYHHKYYRHFGNTAFYRNSYAGRNDGDEVPPPIFERVYEWPQYGCVPGERVTKLQEMLDALGYSVSADGYFGESTEKAVMQFQKDEGIKADGIAAQDTLKALIQEYGVANYIKLT